MLASAISASIVGVDGLPVRVEVDVSFGLPGLTIVGLAGSAVLEARERVRAAIRNSGFEVPPRRITVNLAPADLPRTATSLSGSLCLAARHRRPWLARPRQAIAEAEAAMELADALAHREWGGWRLGRAG
jgi:magnesium chelatase family protein